MDDLAVYGLREAARSPRQSFDSAELSWALVPSRHHVIAKFWGVYHK